MGLGWHITFSVYDNCISQILKVYFSDLRFDKFKILGFQVSRECGVAWRGGGYFFLFFF